MISLGALGTSGFLSRYLDMKWKANVMLLSGVLAALYLYFKWSKKNTVRRMFQESMTIQTHAIRSFQPDVIVASSWGGAVSRFGNTIVLSIFGCLE